MRKTILTTLLATSLLGMVSAQDGIYTLSGGVVTLGAPTDTTPPVVQAPSILRTEPNLVPPPPTIYTRTQTPTITWPLVTDAGGSGLASLTLEITDVDSNIYTYSIPNVTDTSFTLPGTDTISQGNYTARLIAEDGDGNMADATSGTAFMDTIFPTAGFDYNSTTPLISGNLQPTLTGVFDINPTSATNFSPINNVEIQITRPSAGFFQSVSASGAELNIDQWTKTLPNGFLTPGEGVYNVNVRAIDLADNPVNPTGVIGVQGVFSFNSSLIVDGTPASTDLSSSTINSGDNISTPQTFTVTFTDATTVSGFLADDVLISGTGSGTVTNVTPLGSNTFSFLFTPTTLGALTLQIRQNAVLDQGNNQSAASNIFNLISTSGVDAVDPVITGPVVIQRTLPSGNTPPPTWVRRQTPTITWTSVSDDTAVTSLSLRITDSQTNVYTYPVSPVTATSFVLPGTDTIAQGNFRAELLAADAAGNQASALSNFAFMDTIIPTATVSGVSTAVPIVTNDPQVINFGGTFNDDPGAGTPFSGLQAVEIQIRRRNPTTNILVFQQSFTAPPIGGNGTGTWVFNYLPSFPTLPEEGFYDLNIRPVDRALNPNGLPSGTGVTAIPRGILYDITGPQLTDFYAQSSLTDDCIQNPETFFVVYNDISTVSGLDASDVTITGIGNGTVGNVQSIGNNTFTFEFTPTVAGDFTISINDPAVVDQAGNIGGGTLSLDFIADLTPPDLLCAEAFSVVGTPVQAFDPSNPSSVFFSVEFDEPVTNLIPANITISGPGTVASVNPTPGFDTTFVIEVVPSGLGTITLGFENLVIEDCAGNLFDSTGYAASVELVPLLTDLADPSLLLPNDPNTRGKFGTSVDLDEGITIVGYPDFVVGGAAVVFEDEDATTKTQTALLLPLNPALNDDFGASVAHSGFWALVGAPYADVTSPSSVLNAGSATFFKRDRTTGMYSTSAALTKNSGSIERESRFGTSVAINGSYAIVGEPYGRNGGSADVFVLDVCNDTWSFQQTLTANDISRYDDFGLSVAIDGNYALISSPRDDDRGSDSGSVYVFVRTGTNWTQAAKIIPGNNVRQDRFGQAIDYVNDRLVVGTPGFDFGGILNRGSAYLFERSFGSTFTPVAQLNSSLLISADSFGDAVAINKVGEVIVGAPLSNIIGVDSGAAFIFIPDFGYTDPTLVTYLNNARNNYFGGAVGISTGYSIIMAPGASHPDSAPNTENLYTVNTGIGLLTPNPVDNRN